MKYKDYMIDIETADTEESAVILSIGAVAFNVHNGEIDIGHALYINLNPDHQYKRTRSPDTMEWWSQQSQEARDAFEDPAYPKRDILFALRDLDRWISINCKSGASMWSHDFDKKILRHAYSTNELAMPWHYRDERDVRTLCYLAKRLGLAEYKATFDGTPHRAVDDAIFQARYCSYYFARIHDELHGVKNAYA